jgi:hypothetical protein
MKLLTHLESWITSYHSTLSVLLWISRELTIIINEILIFVVTICCHHMFVVTYAKKYYIFLNSIFMGTKLSVAKNSGVPECDCDSGINVDNTIITIKIQISVYFVRGLFTTRILTIPNRPKSDTRLHDLRICAEIRD